MGMKIYHTTTLRSLKSILKHGLLARFATGRMRAVWLHEEWRSVWAFRHVVRRQTVGCEDVVRLELDVPEDMIRRRGDGIFYVLGDVPPDMIHKMTTWAAQTSSVVAWEGKR